jgi:hypothetical protein
MLAECPAQRSVGDVMSEHAVRTSQETLRVNITNANLFMLFVSTVRVQNAEFLVLSQLVQPVNSMVTCIHHTA